MTTSAARWRAPAAALALVGLTFIAYGPALRGGFVWDDDDYVTANRTLRSLDGLARIWVVPGAVPQYYPLTFTSLWIDHRLWGTSPVGYHVTNVALHALNVVLVWLILRRLALPGAWLAAAVFAVHPVHVESVAWITERKNVLSGACYLGAFLAYLHFAADAARARRRWYVAALALFAAALLAKTVACTLPAVLLLVLWWQRGRITRADLRATLPFFALGGILAAVTVAMERYHVGAHGALWALSAMDRVLIAGRALWFYAATLLWPRRLTFVYPRWHVDASVWSQWAFPLAALAVIATLMALRTRIGRGPAAAVACFAVTLVPALGFVDVYPMRYSFVADHYQYLASIALIAPLTAAAVVAARRRLRNGARVLVAAVAAIVVLALATITWRQGHAYADAETLWRDTIAKNPSASMAYINLGMLLHGQGRTEAAVAMLEAALRLEPNDAEVHGDLGLALAAAGRLAAARVHLDEALRLAPDSAHAHNNLANLLVAQGALDDAIAHYREAARLAPAYADPHNNLGNALARRGRLADAAAEYREAVRLDPEYATAYANLGAVLDAERDRDGAIAAYARAVDLAPNDVDARHALAVALGGRGRIADALPHFAAIARLRPGDAHAHYELGAALAATGRLDDAVRAYGRALEIQPEYGDAHNDLGVALAAQGRRDDAARHFREAVRVAPDNAEARENLATVLSGAPERAAP